MLNLELPGDTWNEDFNEKLIKRLFPGQTAKNASKTARNIFTDITSKTKDAAFYPEKLDFSFDFSRTFCARSQENQKICSTFCIFRKNSEITTLCPKNKNSKCPVIFVLCGYIVDCGKIIKKCPVKDGTGLGDLCKGRY